MIVPGVQDFYIPVKPFKMLLRSLNGIASQAIFYIQNNKLWVYTSSFNRDIVMDGEITLPEMGDNASSAEIPINEVSRLLKLCDFADGDYLHLTRQDNIIKFTSKDVRLKLVLMTTNSIIPPKLARNDFFNPTVKFSAEVAKEDLVKFERGLSFIRTTQDQLEIAFSCVDKKLYACVRGPGDKNFTDEFTTVWASDLADGNTFDNEVEVALNTYSQIKIDADKVRMELIASKKNRTNFSFMFTQEVDGLRTKWWVMSQSELKDARRRKFELNKRSHGQ